MFTFILETLYIRITLRGFTTLAPYKEVYIKAYKTLSCVITTGVKYVLNK